MNPYVGVAERAGRENRQTDESPIARGERIM